MGESCFICEKHAGNIEASAAKIIENEYVYVGHIDRGGKDSYLGHIMIDLKRHVPTLGDMEPDEASAFGEMMAKVSRALMRSENAEHIYSLVSGNSVPHLHMHLIPRFPGTPEEYWGPMDVYDWPGAPIGGKNEVLSFCERLQVELSKG